MVKLKNLSELKSGKSISQKDYVLKGIQVIRAGDISDSNKLNIKEKKIIKEGSISPLKLLTKGDIIIVSVGSKIGNCCIIDISKKYIANQNLIVLKPKESSTKLLEKIIKNKEKIRKLSKGVARLHITLKDLGEASI